MLLFLSANDIADYISLRNFSELLKEIYTQLRASYMRSIVYYVANVWPNITNIRHVSTFVFRCSVRLVIHIAAK